MTAFHSVPEYRSSRSGTWACVRESSIELAARSRLLGAYATYDDIGAEVVLAPNRSTRQAAARSDLPHMRQRVCDGALKELLRRRMEGGVRSEVRIERLKSSEEALHSLFPRQRR